MKKWLFYGVVQVLVLAGYAQDSTLHVAHKRDSVMRSLPSPLPNPPFPTSDWDGAPLVGVDATAPNYPLTKVLGLSNHKVKIYGWLDVGGNLST